MASVTVPLADLRYVNDPRYVTDWAAIIEGLRRRGLTFRLLEHSTGLSLPSLMRLQGGATPKHHDGEKLLDFWCYITNSTREQAPRAVRIVNGNARR